MPSHPLSWVHVTQPPPISNILPPEPLTPTLPSFIPATIPSPPHPYHPLQPSHHLPPPPHHINLSDVRPQIGVPWIRASECSIVLLSVRWPWSHVDSPWTHMHSIIVWQSFCYLQTVLCTLLYH